MPITLNGATSGSVTLEAPAVAGTTTLTLPATSGTVVTTTSPSLTTPTMTSPTISSGNLTFSDSTAINSANNLGMRNRIINGDMRIDQRNNGASGTAQAYTVDRWTAFLAQASKLTWQQNAGAVTPPTGYANYLGATSSSAYSVLSTDYFVFEQPIEGLNVSDLAWGTANASTVTLSFQARSSLTGTFGGSLQNSAQSRSYPFTYSISTANTWTTISVTIAGDTTGTWLTTNGVGIRVNFSLGAGSSVSGTSGSWAGSNYWSATGATSVVGTNGATLYITGVQLEVGSVATPFERQIYSNQLAQCQRYFETTYFSTPTAVPTNGSGGYIPIPSAALVNGAQYAFIPFKVTKRVAPTVTTYSYASSTVSVASGLQGTDLTANSGVPVGANAGHFWLSNNSGATISPLGGGFLIHYAATSEL